MVPGLQHNDKNLFLGEFEYTKNGVIGQGKKTTVFKQSQYVPLIATWKCPRGDGENTSGAGAEERKQAQVLKYKIFSQ